MKKFSLLNCVALGGLLSVAAPVLAIAADINIPANSTDTSERTVSGSDQITIGTGAVLSTAAEAILFDKDEDATGVKIDNFGTIQSSDKRAIRADDAKKKVRTIELVNRAGAVIKSTAGDAVQFGENKDGSAITIDNSGTITSGGGQALDLADSHGITLTNRAGGVISTSGGDDAVKTGVASRVDNYGTILSQTIGDGHGIDTGKEDNTNSVIVNHAGGLISGGKHGVSGGDGKNFTTTQTVTVTNEKGATIIGRAGSGVGMDDNGKVINYGTITGAWDGQYMGDPDDKINHPEDYGVDGDGVDIDQNADIENYGLIEGTGATGKKGNQDNHSEGIAAGGGTIVNHADAIIRGFHSGIQIDDGNDGSAIAATTIDNAGTIEGQNLFAVKLVGDWGDTLVNSGVIKAGTGSTFAIDMGAGNDSVTINGGTISGGDIIGGAGTDSIDFFKTGSGLFTFDDNISGFETSHIYGGTVVVRGAFEATTSVTIDSGASLQANKEFTTGALTNNGTLKVAENGAIRNIVVSGNYSQGASSVLEIGVNGTAQKSDQVQVTGTASLADGATFRPKSTGYIKDGATYTVVSSSSLTTDINELKLDQSSPLLSWTLGKDGNDLVLTASQKSISDVAGPTVGGTVLQSLASSANGDMASVVGLLQGLSSKDELRSAIDEIAPAPSAGTFQATTATLGAVSNTIEGRMSSLRVGQGAQAGAVATLAFNDAVSYRATLSDAQPSLGIMNSGAPSNSGVWMQGFGTNGQQDARGGSAGSRSHGAGFAVGGDMMVGEQTVAGVAATFSRSFVRGRGAQSSDRSDISSYQLSAYGSHSFETVFVEGIVGVARNDYDSSRELSALSRTANADYSGWQGFGKIVLGKSFQFDAGTLTPVASLQYAHTNIEGYTETGAGAVSRSVASQSYDTLTPGIGARFALPFQELETGRLSLQFSEMFSYDAVSDRQHVKSSLVGGGAAFETDGIKPDRFSSSTGVGVGYHTGNVTVDAGYELELRQSYTGHAAVIRLRYDM
ncbi:autotransporter domain-containing protein [uncultured Thalassospira sp.]|uniref:autotransporter outer membrane beta-barrel domain-containing protein n=1 Tax=uncultured Thalassospira sp. TaxID=404382 RepID=UPI0030DC14E3